MNKIKLSKIKNWKLMTDKQVTDWCLDNNIDTIINDYGYGLEFALDDIPFIWKDLKEM